MGVIELYHAGSLDTNESVATTDGMDGIVNGEVEAEIGRAHV